MSLSDLVSRLASLDLDALGHAALAGQAEHLADQVRAALATPPGGPHDHPWRVTGALHDSIATETDGDQAIVASTSAVALYQEHGTATLPPRPTFAPLAVRHGEAIAHAIAAALATAIRSA